MDHDTEVFIMQATKAEIESHAKTAHHGPPPCQYFTEHRDTIRWVLGIAGGLILGGAALGWGFMKDSQADRTELRQSVLQLRTTYDIQFRYMIDSMAELKVAMKDLQRDHGGTIK